MVSKIAVVGDAESVAGFKPQGIDVFAIAGAARLTTLLDELFAAEYAIIFVMEPQYEAAGLAQFQQNANITPAIVPVPPLTGSTGAGAAHLGDLYAMATGARPS